MYTFDCYERAKIHALHFPDVGEVVFLMDSDVATEGANWGAKSLHRVANIHITAMNAKFVLSSSASTVTAMRWGIISCGTPSTLECCSCCVLCQLSLELLILKKKRRTSLY